MNSKILLKTNMDLEFDSQNRIPRVAVHSDNSIYEQVHILLITFIILQKAKQCVSWCKLISGDSGRIANI